MIPISRVTDLWSGICCCHPECIPMTGYIITGSVGHISSGFQVSTIQDMVIGTCGHIGTIITGSVGNITQNLGKATVGSQITGCCSGTVISGNPKHTTGR